MAACGSLQHIFDKPLQENPTFLESLSSWKSIKSVNKSNIEDSSSYTEIFGELHFKEQNVVDSSASSSPLLPQSSSSSSSTMSSPSLSFFEMLDEEKNESPSYDYHPRKQYRHSDGFSSMNSESLSLCTEGLGFESSDDVEDLMRIEAISFDFHQNQEVKITKGFSRNSHSRKESKRSMRSEGSFPPPISCIGRTGKPEVRFKSYREDGRFILQEIRIPTQEFLHACREDGRLMLIFIQSDDEILEEDEEEETDEASSTETKSDDNKDQQDRVINEEKYVQITSIDALEKLNK